MILAKERKMDVVRVKQSMDKEYRIMTLDEAFLEALSLSEGRSCEIEEFESDLLDAINKFKSLGHEIEILSIIDEDYKLLVLNGWEYDVEPLYPELISIDLGKCNK